MRSKTYVATPPGETIKEQLIDRGISQKEFALRMDMSEKHISKLINGEVQLTTDVAIRLEMVLGLPANFWSKLEHIYREKLIKVQKENDLMADFEIAKKMPYREMVLNHWIPDEKNPADKVFNLRKFFEVVRLDLLKESPINNVNFRKLGENRSSDYTLLAWAQKAKIEARKETVAPINIKKLENNLQNIRNMTQMNPEEFSKKLQKILADCGIAIVYLPHIGGSFLHGATFYDGPKIVLGMTVRGKYADRFWFSLFHEFGHIVLGHLGKQSETDEISADEFARDTLIPYKNWDQFVRENKFNKNNIINFANAIGIDPGIIVGRLQKEQYIDFNSLNSLKTQYEISA
ncbi:MAG: HigA family addiction module antitoxin [Christensenellales bacterium]|jgi:HTH-type transcriptional regulator/antitoxin HigA